VELIIAKKFLGTYSGIELSSLVCFINRAEEKPRRYGKYDEDMMRKNALQTG
jgi:hypothetical protein